MKRIRTVAVFPTLFTLGNLVCGFFAIVVASRVGTPTSAEVIAEDTVNVMLAGWFIFLAMVFDALDGHIARLTRSSGEFGAQLDSLADLVSFGVAPGFLLVKMCPSFTYHHKEAVWMIAATFAVCAALRLARFNVESDENDDHLHFHGLPSPAAGGSIAGFAILFYTVRRDLDDAVYNAQLDYWVQTLLPFFALATALFMVSRIPYPHVINQVFRGHRSFGHLVALVFALAAVMAIRGYAVPLIFAGFVFGPPAWHLWQRVVVRRAPAAEEEPLF
jgi:CDP-diacylglycerol---serine O-phosphatidyltransferase